MIIRKLEESDFQKGFLETLENLSSMDGLAPNEAQNIFVQKIKTNPLYIIFVAEINDRIVGATTLLVEQKFIHNGGMVGHIEDVAVHKEYERKGIGSKLIKRAIEEARELGCYKVILDCSEEIALFYEKLGFYRKGLEMRIDL